MSRTITALSVACALALTASSGAQQPSGLPPGGGPRGGQMAGGPGGLPPEGGGPASMLLANTGNLKLTDAQVTRLAGIARRSTERHNTMRASLDSAQMAMMRTSRDTVRRMILPTPAQRASMEKARLSEHEDLRDALSVLTSDQQASAFEMIAQRGATRGMRGAEPFQGMPRDNMMQRMGRGDDMRPSDNGGPPPRSPGANGDPATRRPPPARPPQSEP